METFYTVSYVVLGLLSCSILYSQYWVQKQQLKLAKYNAEVQNNLQTKNWELARYNSEMQWKLSLYEKRYPVYMTAMEFISAVLRDANVTNADLFTFLRSTKDKDLLFGDEVREHIEMIYKRALNLNCLSETLESERDMDNRAGIAEAKKRDLEWFTKQFDATKEVFSKYLRVTEA